MAEEKRCISQIKMSSSPRPLFKAESDSLNQVKHHKRIIEWEDMIRDLRKRLA